MVLLKLLHILRIVNLAPLRWDMVKLWMPVNLIFVLMVGWWVLLNEQGWPWPGWNVRLQRNVLLQNIL